MLNKFCSDKLNFVSATSVLKTNYTMDIYLEEAITEAKKGLNEGGIPIGSVIVHNGKILGRGHNRRIQKGSVVLHGEMDAFESAGRQPASVYKNCTLYTTLSPCPMCTGAILLYGIPKVVIGENKTFLGSEDLLKKNEVEVIVVNNAECIEMMEDFIKNNPELWNEDIGV
jgi:creatinine deaminase